MKNVVITGGNQGIGFYMVRQFLKDGKKVAVLDLSLEQLKDLKKDYPEALLTYKCDVTDREKLEHYVDEIDKKWGKIDYAIHNACLCLLTNVEHTGIEVYKQIYEVNFYGALHLTKAVLPIMKQQHSGKIYFTSSGVGVTGFSNMSAYASSKGAIESLAKCLSIENQDTGVTFHILHPPLTRTSSASLLPVPNEMMADPIKVGEGLAKNIDQKSFIICHSFMQRLQIKIAYSFPLHLGKWMNSMTKVYE